MKLNLHSRLLISLLALLVAGFLLLGMVLLSDARNQVDEFRQTQAIYQAKTLAEASLDGLVSKDYELLERWVNSSMPSADYAYAALVSPDGKVLTHTDLSYIGKSISGIQNSTSETIRETRFNNRPVLEVIYPAIIGEKNLANAHIAYYLDTDYVLQNQTITRIVVVLTVILFLLFIATHIVTRSITTPIELLKKSVGKISLDKVVSISHKLENRSDEVGDLSHAFIEMSERLIESHKNLTNSLIANKAIVDSAIDGIILIDSKGNIESANPAAVRLFGFSEDELIGNNINLLMPDDLHHKHNELMHHYRSTGQPQLIGERREIQGKCKDGSLVPIEIALGEIRVDDELKFSGTIRDISSRYEHENAIRIAKEVAEQGSRIKSEFLANISHELRTPMNAILGYVDLMLLMNDFTEEQSGFLHNVSRSSHDLLDIINNILEFTNLDTYSLENNTGDFNIHHMAKAIFNKSVSDFKDRPIVLNKDIDASLPEALSGDIQHIKSILAHLIDNAFKFTKQGEINISIQLEQLKDNIATVRFEVSDTGIGIEPYDINRIFDLFTQGDGSHTRNHGGTGIGLALCKKMVEVMQGEMGVNSKPGEGSCFWFSLPLNVIETQLEPDTIAEHTKATEADTPAMEKTESNEKHVLIVEDNPFNQELMETMLDFLGYKSDVADNGLLGVRAVEKEHYDLVFMDCQMPVMNGYEATRKIREIEKSHTPIIAVTANALDGDREKCIESGMDDYMTKPYTRQELEDMLGKWIA